MLAYTISIENILLGFLLLPFIYLLIRYPEITFALFISAGTYKGDPRLSFLPEFLDLTIMFGSFSLIGVILKIMFKKTKFVIPSKKILIPYLIIVLIGTISLSYTTAPIYGMNKLLRFLTITSLCLYLPFFIFQEIKPFKSFFLVIIVLAILMVLDIISGGVTPGEFKTYEVFGSDYLTTGEIIGFAVIIVFYYFFLNAHSKLFKFIYLSLLPLLIWGLLIIAGRGPIIALAFSVLSIPICFGILTLTIKSSSMFLARIKVNLKLLVPVFILFSFGTVVAIVFSEYFSTTFHRFSLAKDLSTTGRIELFKKALVAISSFPEFITGLGIGGFSVFYAGIDYQSGVYPHNIFLEIGSEFGIFGLISIVLLIFWSLNCIISSIKKAQSDELSLSITLFALLVYMVVNASKSGDINHNRILFVSIGLIYAFENIIINKKHSLCASYER